MFANGWSSSSSFVRNVYDKSGVNVPITHKLLPIAHYVTFLNEIKIYVPLTSAKFRTAQSDAVPSAICSVM